MIVNRTQKWSHHIPSYAWAQDTLSKCRSTDMEVLVLIFNFSIQSDFNKSTSPEHDLSSTLQTILSQIDLFNLFVLELS